VFKDFTLLCAGDYDYFWEAMKRIGVLSADDAHGKGCIYTNYFGSVTEREAVRIAIEEVSVGGSLVVGGSFVAEDSLNLVHPRAFFVH
jgi:hypothetical protein